MLVVTHRSRHGLVLTEVTLRDRIAARLRAHALDLALASGTDPESTLMLAVRADALARPHVRRYLARSLERILTESTRPPGLRPTPVSLGRRRAIRAATDELEALIARLRSAGPVAVRGIAQVLVLLRDGGGPLYAGVTEPDLRSAIEQALTHVDVPVVVSPRAAGRMAPASPKCVSVLGNAH